jgi:hypothetical protein
MAILEGQVNNPELAWFYTRLLMQLRGPSPEPNINAAIEGDLPARSSSLFYPGNDTDLAFYYGGDNARKILLIDGVRTSTQANLLIDGYSASLPVQVLVGNNRYLQEQAQRIVGRVLETELLSREYIDLVGYSAGGAVALGIAQRLQTFEFRPKMKISSFGAPRMGQPLLRSAMSSLPIARWMTDADPIPLIPLRLQDAPQIAALVHLGTLLNWSNFVHVQGGISITPTGVTSAQVVPPLASANPIASVVNWYFGVENDPNNPHSLTQYATRLEAATRASSQPATVRVDEAPSEHSTHTGRRDVNQVRERVEREIFTTAANQTENPIITPEATLFKAFRSGRVWYVGFGDNTVITAGPEKRARHIARAGNDFLRSLQKQAVVDPVALLAQFDAFLVLAQDPSTGFRPTINTTPPD